MGDLLKGDSVRTMAGSKVMMGIMLPTATMSISILIGRGSCRTTVRMIHRCRGERGKS